MNRFHRRHFLETAALGAAAVSLPAAFWTRAFGAHNPDRAAIALLNETTIAGRRMDFARLPAGLRVDENLALVLASPALTRLPTVQELQ
jgi:hypothetical protein